MRCEQILPIHFLDVNMLITKLLHLMGNIWIAAIQCKDPIWTRGNVKFRTAPDEMCYWLCYCLICPFLQHVSLFVLSRNNNAHFFYWDEWRSFCLEIPHCQCYVVLREHLKIQYWSLMQSPHSNDLPLSSAILAALMGRWNLRGQELAFLK